MSDDRESLVRLGVLVGRACKRRKIDSVFVIVGASRPPRVPQDMVQTLRIPIVR